MKELKTLVDLLSKILTKINNQSALICLFLLIVSGILMFLGSKYNYSHLINLSYLFGGGLLIFIGFILAHLLFRTDTTRQESHFNKNIEIITQVYNTNTRDLKKNFNFVINKVYRVALRDKDLGTQTVVSSNTLNKPVSNTQYIPIDEMTNETIGQ